MGDKTITLSYQGFDDFDANTRDLNLQVDEVSGVVHLTKGVNYTDEMGNCNLRDLELFPERTGFVRSSGSIPCRQRRRVAPIHRATTRAGESSPNHNQ